MFNWLEKNTMDVLENANLKVVYEPIIKIEERRSPGLSIGVHIHRVHLSSQGEFQGDQIS